jgi:hypothetical protein
VLLCTWLLGCSVASATGVLGAAWMRGIAYRLLLLLHRDWFGMGWTALAYAWMDNDTGIRDYKHELSLMHFDAYTHP